MRSELAKILRQNATDAERRLWARLRSRQLDGYKFRRQVPLGPYVADFVCLSERLVVEVDGGQHSRRRNADAARTVWLEGSGFRVLRFWNNDVLGNLEGVLETIRRNLPPTPSLPRKGGSDPAGEGDSSSPSRSVGRSPTSIERPRQPFGAPASEGGKA